MLRKLLLWVQHPDSWWHYQKQSLVANTTMMEATSLQKLLALLALDVAILHLFRGWELQLQVNSRIA